MEAVRITATRVRPGHTVRLEYGPVLFIDVDAAANEPQWVRLTGALRHPGVEESHTYADDSRHFHHTRLKVIADRNEPPRRLNPTWHDLTRVVRHWEGDTATVWSLDDPTEPLGHGGRLRGEVEMTGAVWVWRAAFGDRTGTTTGDYLTAEAALLAATKLDETEN